MDFCQYVIPVHILNDDTRVYSTESESHLNEQKRAIDTYEDGTFFSFSKNKSRLNELCEIFERRDPDCNYKPAVSIV